MAVLGNIRKRSWLLIAVIGGALFLFIISEFFGALGGGGLQKRNAVIEVDDQSISYEEFSQDMERFSQRAGGRMTDAQISNQVFETLVREAILSREFDELGLEVEADQIADYVEEAGWFRQIPQFADDNGNFDKDMFLDAILDWKENDPARYELWKQDEEQIVFFSKQRILNNLIKAGMTASLQEGYFNYKTQSNKVDVEFVRVPFTSIADSSIAVSKEEIAAYIKDNPDEFEQEESRNIRFVFFELNPSEADVNASLTEVSALLANDNPEDNFTLSTDLDGFFSVHSDRPLDTLPRQKAQLPAALKDTIDTMEAGAVFGPFKDGDTYNLARLIARKPEANVRARHILVAYQGATRANESVTRSREEAEEKARGVLKLALEEDSDFAELARENSDGPTATRGGDLGFFQEGQMAQEFNDYCFGNPAGSIGLVETDFGFHVIKVEEKQDLYQVAHLVREIIPSEDTENKVYNDALTFEKQVKESQADKFTNIAEQSSYQVRPVNKVKAMDENLPGLGNRRQVIRWAFEKGTQVGDIRKFELPEGYAVVQMTKEYEKGTMSVEEASITARPEILKRKKAELIKQKYAGKSMQEIADEASGSVTKGTAITMASPVLPGAGREPAIVGKAFSMEVDEISDLLVGETGVFRVKLLNFNEAIKLPNFAPFSTTLSRTRLNRVNTGYYNALKESAEIEDNRSEYY